MSKTRENFIESDNSKGDIVLDVNGQRQAFRASCHQLSASQRSYVDGIARDFRVNDIDQLAIRLGYSNSSVMAKDNGFSNIYDYFTLPGHAGRYLNIERQLRLASIAGEEKTI